MCMDIKQELFRVNFAKKNMYVFKWLDCSGYVEQLMKDADGKFFCIKKVSRSRGIFSPFRGTRWKNKRMSISQFSIGASSEGDDYISIFEGIHAYTTKRGATTRFHRGSVLWKAVIPQGSAYITNGDGEIVCLTMTLINPITTKKELLSNIKKGGK